MKVKRRIKHSFILSLILLSAPAIGFTQPNIIEEASYLSSLEKAVIREMNMARTSPGGYLSLLEEFKENYDGKLLKLPEGKLILTKEGTEAVVEAIRSLRSQKPVLLLRPSKGMSLGARDHAKDLGSSGRYGHQGSDSSQPWDRVNRYGIWEKTIGENISFGSDQARIVVISFIVDDGDADRGHRKNIFNPDFHVVGVACRHPAAYGTICVITFAGGYQEKN